MAALKFGLFSDLHLDVIQDGAWRLSRFLSYCAEESVDFVLSAGDFACSKGTEHSQRSSRRMSAELKDAIDQAAPIPKIDILRQYNSFPKPHYHTLGNHDLDCASKEEAVKLLGIPGRYYDFHQKGWHFLVLDANHYRDGAGTMRGYCRGDYFGWSDLPYLDEEQLEWLEESLRASPEPAVLVSHQALYPRGGGLRNYGTLRRVLAAVTDGGRPRVRMCIYGHHHRDEYAIRDGVLHYCINSISNHWCGEDYACRRFSPQVEADFPNLRYTFPYRDPVYAIVTLEEDGVTIRGQRSEFIPPTPEELAYRSGPVSASVADRHFLWTKGEEPNA